MYAMNFTESLGLATKLCHLSLPEQKTQTFMLIFFKTLYVDNLQVFAVVMWLLIRDIESQGLA